MPPAPPPVWPSRDRHGAPLWSPAALLASNAPERGPETIPQRPVTLVIPHHQKRTRGRDSKRRSALYGARPTHQQAPPPLLPRPFQRPNSAPMARESVAARSTKASRDSLHVKSGAHPSG